MSEEIKKELVAKFGEGCRDYDEGCFKCEVERVALRAEELAVQAQKCKHENTYKQEATSVEKCEDCLEVVGWEYDSRKCWGVLCSCNATNHVNCSKNHHHEQCDCDECL